MQLRAADLSPLRVEACDRCSQHHLVIVRARWKQPSARRWCGRARSGCLQHLRRGFSLGQRIGQPVSLVRSAEPGVLPPDGDTLVVSAKSDVGAIVITDLHRLTFT
jgi:hypothetical protein